MSLKIKGAKLLTITLAIILTIILPQVISSSQVANDDKTVKVSLISRQPNMLGGVYMGTLFLGYPYS